MTKVLFPHMSADTWALNAEVLGLETPAAVKLTNVKPRPLLPADRYKSETERCFARLLEQWQYERKILQWHYEPMQALYLAPKTTYTADWLLEPSPDNPPDALRPYLDHPFRLLLVETKNKQVWEKNWIKAKTAAALYPCFRFVRAQWKQDKWHWKLIPPL